MTQASPEFEALFTRYPEIIAQMPAEFTAQEFILRLAQQAQQAYVEALYLYRESGVPFMRVHRRLSEALKHHGDLIERGADKQCRDIFGNQHLCQRWHKRQGF